MAELWWDEPKVTLLRQAVADKLSAAQAGRKIGCSRMAAASKARKLGLRFASERPIAKGKPDHASLRGQRDERRRLASLERDWRAA